MKGGPWDAALVLPHNDGTSMKAECVTVDWMLPISNFAATTRPHHTPGGSLGHLAAHIAPHRLLHHLRRPARKGRQASGSRWHGRAAGSMGMAHAPGGTCRPYECAAACRQPGTQLAAAGLLRCSAGVLECWAACLDAASETLLRASAAACGMESREQSMGRHSRCGGGVGGAQLVACLAWHGVAWKGRDVAWHGLEGQGCGMAG